MVFKDSRQILVNCSLQFILVLIVYPLPEHSLGLGKKNYYRHFLGRLHRAQDFQFLVDGMTRVLHQPVCCDRGGQDGPASDFPRALFYSFFFNFWSRFKPTPPTFPAAKNPSDGPGR